MLKQRLLERPKVPACFCTLDPVARHIVQRLERDLPEARAGGLRRLIIGEFENGQNRWLGTARRETLDPGPPPEDWDWRIPRYPLPVVRYSGPIEQVVGYLHEHGMTVEVSDMMSREGERSVPVGLRVYVLAQ